MYPPGMPFSRGIVPLALANPLSSSVMQAMLWRVLLQPVGRHDRIGEHSAVVCHCLYRTPSPATKPHLGHGSPGTDEFSGPRSGCTGRTAIQSSQPSKETKI